MRIIHILLVAVFGLLPIAAVAQNCAEGSLRVGYHQFPGVITHDEITGQPVGLAVDLLQELRVSTGQELCFIEYPDFGSIFNEAGVNDVDLMAGAFTINEVREAAYDFSMPFMNAGVGIMVPTSQEAGVMTIVGAIFTPVIGQTLLLFLGFLLFAGFFLWIAERGNNEGIPDKFPAGFIQGCYCAFDIASTVGFGRVEPRRILGRLIAIPVFVAGAIFVGTLIGSVSSALTVAELESSISSPADLRGRTVATKTGTSNVALLQRLGAKVVEVSTRSGAVEVLQRGDAEAVVYDAPFLQFVAVSDDNLMVASVFAPQHYGFAMPTGSELREPLNSVLLQMWDDGSIDRLTKQYFGE